MNFTAAMAEALNYGSFFQLRDILNAVPPDMVNPALMQRVMAINSMRSFKNFVPMQNNPDPADPAIADLRALMPPQVGLLLCTVPAGHGLLCMADGARYVFWTETKYAVVMAGNVPATGLLVLPAGQHYFMITAHGYWDRETERYDPLLTDNPIQHCGGMIDVQPGCVTEIVPARRNNFSQLTYHVVYH